MQNSQKNRKTEHPEPVRLYLASFAAGCGGLSIGGTYSFSAQALPSMESDGRFGLTRDSAEESWIGSLAVLGGLFGGLLGGVLGGFLGRKRALQVATIPVIAGWILIICAQNLSMIYVGRFLTGFTAGILTIAMCAYISEISTPKVRGRLLSSASVMVMVGTLLSFGLGVVLNWTYLSVFHASLNVIFAILLFFVPESPYYLIQQERQSDAKKSLLWLRGTSNCVDAEMEEIARTVHEKPKPSVLNLFRAPTLEPLLITVGLMFVQQVSGYPCIAAYSTNIFKTAGSSLDPAVATLLVGVVMTVTSLFALYVTDKMGRKFWLVLSASIMATSLFVLGLHDKLITEDEGWGWVPVLCVVTFAFGYCLGYGPLPYATMSEILTAETRNMATGLVGFMNPAFSFTITKIFPSMLSGMKPYGTYWFLAGVALIGVAFPPLFMLETRGKTLEEIQRHYARKLPTSAADNSSSCI